MVVVLSTTANHRFSRLLYNACVSSRGKCNLKFGQYFSCDRKEEHVLKPRTNDFASILKEISFSKEI